MAAESANAITADKVLPRGTRNIPGFTVTVTVVSENIVLESPRCPSHTGITEPSGNNYAQVEFDTWNAASGNPEAATNNGAITMPTPSGSWGLITYSVLYLDTTPAARATVTNQTPDNGDTVEWLDTQFSVEFCDR